MSKNAPLPKNALFNFKDYRLGITVSSKLMADDK